MSEAADIAWNLMRRNGGKPDVTTHDQACKWISEKWPDWRDWIGVQTRDNIADVILAAD